MATKWISPTWRMPEESNQSKFSNYSMSFDGSSEFINLGTSIPPRFSSTGDGNTEPWTVSLWANFDLSSNEYPIEFPYGEGTRIWQILTISGKLCFGNRYGTALCTESGTTALNSNKWNNIIVSFDGVDKANITSWKLYINGVNISITTRGHWGNNTGFDILIGRSFSTLYYDGKIDHVAIFDYALSETQVKYLFNNNAGGSTPNPQNPMAISGNAPIAYYDLGGSSTGDAAASSPNTLTVPNSSVPSATVFDITGSGQLIDLGGSGLWSNILVGTNRTGVATFSYWIKGPIPAWNRTYEMGVIGQDLLRPGTAQKLYYRFGSGVIYKRWNMPAGVDLDASNWLHIVLVFKAGSVTDSSGVAAGNGVADIDLFINGDLCSQDLLSAGASANTWGGDNFGIRNYSGATMTERSNGQIWNSELTASEITTLYNNGKPYLGTQPQAANLKGWWRLNIDTSNWNGSNWEIGNSTANYSTALNFDGGINNGININNDSSLEPSTSFTLSCWIKPESSQNAYAYPVYKESSNSSHVAYGFYLNGSSTKATTVTQNGVVVSDNIGDLRDNKWHHIVQSFDGSEMKVYLDGFQSGTTKTLTGDVSYRTGSSSRNDLCLGKASYSTSGYFNFKGDISNVALFNSSIDAAGVSTLYNNGTPETSISYSSTSWWKLDNITTGIQDSVGSNNGTITGGVTQIDSFVSTLNGLSDGMTTANLVNSDLERSIPYSSYSMEFDGATEKIALSSGVSTGNNYSVSLWLNPKNVSSGNSYLFSDSTTSPFKGLALDQGSSTAGGFGNFYYYTGAVNIVNNTAILGDVWSHIVISFNITGQEIKFYVNGVLDKTTTSVANISALIDEFGTRDDGNYFNGKLSNISIFTTPLSQDQILTIYNGGVPNDISSLSPVGWWSLGGDSYFDGGNFICPDLGSGGNNGTSTGMGGTELVGEGPGSTANGEATGMNIPGNLQGNAPNSNANAFSVNMNADDKSSSVPVIP